jgi:hypothetical protein
MLAFPLVMLAFGFVNAGISLVDVRLSFYSSEPV